MVANASDLPTPRLGTVRFPPVQHLYPDQATAHRECLECFTDAVEDGEAETGRRVSDRVFIRRFLQLWSLWTLYAPPSP